MRKLLTSTISMMAFFVVAMGVKAQTINYTATVTGVFDINGGSSGSGWSVVGGGTQLRDANGVLITYVETTFNVSTTPPYPTNATINGNATNNAIGELIVGTVNSGADSLPANTHLTLTVTYTSPGTNATVYTSTIKGQVKTSGQGGISIIAYVPDPGPAIPFTLPGYDNTSFDLTLDSRSVTSGHTDYLSGTINATATPLAPEAGSLALLLPGLIPLGFVLRRRRRNVC